MTKRKIRKLSPYCIPGFKDKPLKNPFKGNPESVNKYLMGVIFDVVCEYFSIKLDDLFRKTRKAKIVYARHCAIYLIFVMRQIHITKIAKIMIMHYSSAIYAKDSISENIKVNSFVRATGSYVADDIAQLKKLIKKKKCTPQSH